MRDMIKGNGACSDPYVESRAAMDRRRANRRSRRLLAAILLLIVLAAAWYGLGLVVVDGSPSSSTNASSRQGRSARSFMEAVAHSVVRTGVRIRAAVNRMFPDGYLGDIAKVSCCAVAVTVLFCASRKVPR